MPRITLEKRPKHEDLTAFAFATGVLSGLLSGLLALVGGLGLVGAALVGGVVLLGLAGWGLLNPPVFTLAYRIWNRVARRFASLAQRLAMAVTFHLVFTPVSMVGARFEKRARREGSAWGSKDTPELSEQLGYVPMRGEPEEWSGRLRRWSRDRPSRWSLFLLPFLRLLDSLEGQTAVSTAEDVYTLY
jgi:hypothetical protein